jgi:hypothetical protein
MQYSQRFGNGFLRAPACSSRFVQDLTSPTQTAFAVGRSTSFDISTLGYPRPAPTLAWTSFPQVSGAASPELPRPEVLFPSAETAPDRPRLVLPQASSPKTC